MKIQSWSMVSVRGITLRGYIKKRFQKLFFFQSITLAFGEN